MSEEQTSLEEGTATDDSTETSAEQTTETVETTEETSTEESTETTSEQTDQWGDDWRTNYAGDDEKLQKRLERYASPKAALDALVAAQNKISSGELKSALPADASDEEKANWRTENGIPESASDYEVSLPDGFVVGEADQPIVDSFLEAAHGSNLHPSQVNDALAWYFNHQETQAAELEAQDSQARQAGEDALHAEWGTDYRKNLQMANNLLESAPEGLKDQIMGARLADGTPLGNNPEALNWLVDMSRQINPMATVVPGSGTNAVQAVESELADIKSLMGDRTSEYWKGPKAETMQARYRELTSALQKAG
jgi:hypothetical protein